LSPGEYVFRVKACNNDGVWNEDGTRLSIRIVPPFWRTAWFYALVLVSSIGIVVGTTRTISRQRFRRDLALATERLEAARLLETERLERELALQRERLEKEIALEKERGRISQDLHDELGPGMTKILLLSNIAAQASETESEDAGASQAGMTHEITLAAQEVMKAMSGVVWLTKPENDSLANLIAYIREYADDYLDRAGIRLEWNMTGAVPEWTMQGTVRRGVFLVVKECLNNVVKHSGASKTSILLDFSTENIVRVVITDNGRGFDPSNTRRFGNGMNNMQRRIEEIGGKFTLASSNAGTRVEIAVVMKLGEES
jgi:signal transduction histidine kinase